MIAARDLKDALDSLQGHGAFQRVLEALHALSDTADTAAIMTNEHADVARGRARGIREVLAILERRKTP